MFDLAGINMDLMSEPVPTGTSAGPIRPEISSATGLAPDTQIVSISHDQIAARRWNMYAGPSLLELHLSCMTVLCSRLKKILPILRWSSPLQNRPALQWKLRLDAWVSVRQEAASQEWVQIRRKSIQTRIRRRSLSMQQGFQKSHSQRCAQGELLYIYGHGRRQGDCQPVPDGMHPSRKRWKEIQILLFACGE